MNRARISAYIARAAKATRGPGRRQNERVSGGRLGENSILASWRREGMVFSPFVSKLKPFLARNLRFFPGLAYAATVAVFLWICSQFYLPGKGFTYLIEFGAREEAHYLPELRAINHYSLPDSNGYDGQAYAQIAMRPHLGDPVLQ